MSRSSKRKAPSSAPPAPAKPKVQRVAAIGARRRILDGDGGAERADGRLPEEVTLDEERDSRGFWEQFATELLTTWILDWKEPVLESESRDDLLTRLVKGRAVLKQPAADVALSELQRVWRKVRKPGKAAVAPDRFVPAAAASDGGRRPQSIADDSASETIASLRKQIDSLTEQAAKAAQPKSTAQAVPTPAVSGTGVPDRPAVHDLRGASIAGHPRWPALQLRQLRPPR